MKETVLIGWEIFFLGLIAFLLFLIMFMLRKVIELLTLFQDPHRIATPVTADFNRSLSTMECTEEELAAITAVLAHLLPDQKLNIVNLKLIQ